MRNESGLGRRTAVEKVVKRAKGLRLMQVVENGRRINFKTCHSWHMLCDIIIV